MSPEARCRTCFSLENIHLRNPLNPKIKPIVHTSLSYSAGVIGPTEMDRLGIASVPCATQTFIIPTMCVKETARVRPERNAAHDEGKHRQLIHHFHCYRSPTHSRGETEKPKHISNEVPPSLTLVSPPPHHHTRPLLILVTSRGRRVRGFPSSDFGQKRECVTPPAIPNTSPKVRTPCSL